MAIRFKAIPIPWDDTHPGLEVTAPQGGDELLRQINAMPREGKKGIPLCAADMIAGHEWARHAESSSSTRESVEDLANRWLERVSFFGYYIELTGDEYEQIEDEAAA